MAERRRGGWFVLAEAADGKALILDPALGRPQTLSAEELATA